MRIKPAAFIIGLTFFNLAFFMARIHYLLIQPPFIDEATYAVLATDIANHVNQKTLSAPLQIGLPPIFIYLSSLIYRLTLSPILSLRVVSLIAFLFGSYFLFFYLRTAKARNIILPLIIYYTCPFLAVYSQMGLMETTAVTLGLIFLWQSEISVKNNGYIIPATIFLLLTFAKYTLTFVVIYYFVRCLQTKKVGLFIKFLIFFSFLFLICLNYELKLFQTFNYHQQGGKILSWPLIYKNFRVLSLWLIDYFNLKIIVLVTVIFILKRKNPILRAILIMATFTLLVYIIISTNFFPRYLIISTLILTVPFSFLKNKPMILFVFILVAIIYVPNLYAIMFNLADAKIAREDIYQYATDWTSGKNVIALIKHAPPDSVVCVRAEEFDYFTITKESFFKTKNIIFKTNCQTEKIVTAKSIPME